MAGGTLSVIETKAPKDSREWMSSLGQLYADTLNRKREEKEVRVAVKIASVVCDIGYAESRRALTEKQIGKAVQEFKTA